MKRSSNILIIIVLFLLIMGWVLFLLINPEGLKLVSDLDFQIWFWERRGLDLVVQVLLVFAGALGIAAILPMEED
jgi:hypothetical protein